MSEREARREGGREKIERERGRGGERDLMWGDECMVPY